MHSSRNLYCRCHLGPPYQIKKIRKKDEGGNLEFIGIFFLTEFQQKLKKKNEKPYGKLLNKQL